jgi:hypothetical protein
MRDTVGAEQLQQVHHGTTQPAGSDGGPDGQRSAPSAADGQQPVSLTPVSVTPRECARKPWRIMTADPGIGGPLTWRSSHAFTILNTTQFHVRRPVQISHGGSPGCSAAPTRTGWFVAEHSGALRSLDDRPCRR